MAPVSSDENLGHLHYNVPPTKPRKTNHLQQHIHLLPQAVSFDTRIIGANERIQLLKAPSMESNKIWKNRAFNYAYNRLRAKLCTRTDNEFRPETLITVFSNHFPLSTQNAGHD